MINLPAQLQLPVQLNRSTRRSTKAWRFMQEKLLRKLIEIKRNVEINSDSRTPRRDAISMSKTSLPIPLKKNLRVSSLSMVISKAWSFSLRKVRLSMPSFATNLLIMLLLPDNNSTCTHSMASSSMSTITNLRKLESSNKKKQETRLTSRLFKDLNLLQSTLNSWTIHKLFRLSTCLSNSLDVKTCNRDITTTTGNSVKEDPKALEETTNNNQVKCQDPQINPLCPKWLDLCQANPWWCLLSKWDLNSQWEFLCKEWFLLLPQWT